MSRPGALDIAIVGMACRFPGAADLFAYWESILAGVDPSTGPDAPGPTSVVADALADAGLDGSGPVGRRLDLVGGSALAALDLAAKAIAARRVDFAVVGERSGAVVLKRRLDAEHDGDRVYAVLKGVGIALDGAGDARTIRRAYRSSGVEPATVGLVFSSSPLLLGEEPGVRGVAGPPAPNSPAFAGRRPCLDPHPGSLPEGEGGRGTTRTDLRELRAVFPPIPRGRRVLGAGSPGIASLIKAALALHHRILPPSLLPDQPHSLLDRPDRPFSINPKVRPWIQGDPATPRRAGVNIFGFEGIDAHAILEEHPPSNDADHSPGALLTWDCEAILLSAGDRAGLIGRIHSLLGWLDDHPDVRLKDLAYTLNVTEAAGPCRLGLVAKSLDDLADRLRGALAKLLDLACRSIRDARGIYFREPGESPSPKVALMFPGEGSQYLGMLADLCPHFPEVRALFDTSDRIARESGATIWPSEHLFGHSPDQGSGLWSAEVAVNVVLSAQWGLFQMLTKLGLLADAVIGHSSGELLALAAAGVVEVDRSFEEKLGDLGTIFGRLETSGELPTARLVAVAGPREKVEAAISVGDLVAVAMDNCPHQVVLAGEPGSVNAVVERLKLGGMACEDLPFERAYHTTGFAPAVGPIARFFHSLGMGPPRVPVYSCASERRMPDDPGTIRQLAVDQWTQAVGFRRAIEAMHGDGLDVFVDVGARGNLAGFVEDTLRGRSVLAVAANLPRRSGTAQLNHLVALLFARGVELKPGHLYARRRPSRLDVFLRSALPTVCLPVALGEGRGITNGLGKLSHSNGEGRATPLIPGPSPRGRGEEERAVGLADTDADPTLLDFQETMAAFLRTQQEVLDAFLAVPPIEEEFSFHLSNGLVDSLIEAGPWAGVLVSLVEGREAVAMLTLGLDGDPVAEHHTLGGRRVSSVHPDWRGLPVLPFAVMAEMLAEAAARLVPGRPVLGLRDVRAHRWIRYEDEPIALEIRASIDPDLPASVRVAIHNRGPLRAIRPVEPPVFEGVVAFGHERSLPPIAPDFRLENPDACRFTPESIYGEQWLFHGPALQAVVGIGPIGMGGIEGTLRVLPLAPLLRDGDDPDQVLTDPILLDNFTHLLGGWGLDRLADDGDVIFPLRMGELAIFGDRPTEGSDVSCRIVIRKIERHRVLADADLVRLDGSTWMTIRGWEDWRFRWPGRYRDGFRQPDRTFLGERLNLKGIDPSRAKAVWLEPPGDMGRPVWRDVLEHVQLGPDERAAYLALPGPDLRRTHRLWGRIAAKEAARRLRLDLGHPPEYPADLIVERDPLGRPSIRSRAEGDSIAVSIAHVDGLAVALACLDPNAHPGIDVEPIVGRSSTFETTAFLPGELALLGDRSGDERAEWVARLWCAKEAVAKATGLGFVDGPSGVEVVAIDPDGSLGARLRGGLAEGCPELSRRIIRVVAPRRGDFVWAWTLGEGMGS